MVNYCINWRKMPYVMYVKKPNFQKTRKYLYKPHWQLYYYFYYFSVAIHLGNKMWYKIFPSRNLVFFSEKLVLFTYLFLYLPGIGRSLTLCLIVSHIWVLIIFNLGFVQPVKYIGSGRLWLEIQIEHNRNQNNYLQPKLTITLEKMIWTICKAG